MMRKIILVSPSLDPNVTLGGISAVASFIVNNNKNCNYIHFEQGKRDFEVGGLKRLLSLCGYIRKWKDLLCSNPDMIVHYNFPLSALAIIRDYPFMLIAMRMKRKMVIHVHGGLYMNSTNIPLLPKLILKKIFRWDVPFIVLSEKEKNKIETQFGANQVFVLPNCVELDDYEKTVVSDSAIKLGYIGRVTATKGMSELLEACIIIKDNGIPFRLIIAGTEGDGEHYVEQFKAVLENKFIYAGIVSGESKREFLRNIDVFVLPSYFEGLPMSLLECMSYGVIPVTTPVGSIPDVVRDGENGLFIKDHDVDSIVDAVKKIYESNNLRTDLSKSARKTINDKFSPIKYFEKLNKIYEAL